jgi:hypothetical protein
MAKARRIPKYERSKKVYARVRINGKEHPLGKYGSPESHLRYDELIAEHVTGETATGLVLEAYLR